MKIIGLLIVKNEADILRECLDHAARWMDGIVAIDNGSTDASIDILEKHSIVVELESDNDPFDESRLVPKLIDMAKGWNADWYIDNDADEFFPLETRSVLERVPAECNLLSVQIESHLDGRPYNLKRNWRRAYRNKPELFDYSILKQLHGGKVPIAKERQVICMSTLNVTHRSIRSYEQGMRKYENYKALDVDGIQKSYEHIRQLAECLKTKDFTGVLWLS